MTVPYITEERLRVLGFVGDLGDMSSAEIRNLIVSASAKVDAFCNVPKLPQPYSFRGGTVVDDQYEWNPGDSLTPSQRRFFVRQTPLKEVTSLRIYVTNDQYTEFVASELFINKIMGVIEVTSLSLTSSAPLGAFVLPNIGLHVPQARITYVYGWEFTAVDEVLEPTDAFYFRALNQFWDDSAVTVKVNGATVTTGFTLDRTEGAVVFDVAQAPDAVVTASYGYSMPQDIALATGWITHDLLTERELHDKGMGNVRSLRVGEISIDRGRDVIGRLSAEVSEFSIPPQAENHLLPYRFVTAR